MHRVFRGLGLGVFFLLSVSGCGNSSESTSRVPAAASHTSGTLSWTSNWDAALKRARAEEKFILIDFYADWCVWCKKLDRTTLSDKAVSAYLGERVIPVRLNTDREGRKLARRFRVEGLPTLVILNSEGREVARIPGFLPPDAFLERVQQILGS